MDVLARGADRPGPGGQRDGRWSGGSDQMMSELSLSGRDSIGQDGAPSSRNGRVKRAVRISSIVAQEVSAWNVAFRDDGHFSDVSSHQEGPMFDPQVGQSRSFSDRVSMLPVLNVDMWVGIVLSI